VAAQDGTGAGTTMVTAALGAGLLAGYGAAVPLGPIAVLLINLATRASYRTAVAAGLGVATVDGGYALAATLLGNAVRIPPFVRWIAAGVLVLIAVRTVVSAFREGRVIERPAHAYLALVGLTALNPTTLVYFAALAVGHGTGDTAVYVLAVFAASASWQVLLVTAGRLLGRITTRARLATALVSAAVIVVLAVRLAW
jgi:arginine exporter protein ArgO